jgi:hypothetical protein
MTKMKDKSTLSKVCNCLYSKDDVLFDCVASILKGYKPQIKQPWNDCRPRSSRTEVKGDFFVVLGAWTV